jgi:hypothetical protein
VTSVSIGMGRAVVLLALAAVVAAGDRIERRERGERSGKQSVAVAGHMVAFETAADRPFLRSVLVHGARYGEGYDPARTSFEVAVLDEKRNVLAKTTASYSLFAFQIFTWVEVPLPEPVRVPRSFHVVVDFRASATKGVYLGYADVARSHSSYLRLGEREQPFAKGKEWMIRARTSATEKTLRSPPRHVREALRAAQVPALDASDLASALARISEAARVAVVLDHAPAAAPAVPAGSAEAALDALALACGLAWDARWGVAYVASPGRLADIPLVPPDPPDDGPTPPDAVALRTELARRLVDLACRDLPLEDAVAQVSSWFEFPVRFDPRVDRRQRVTVAVESLRGQDALALLLLPRGYGYRIVDRSIEIAPLDPK